MDVLVIDRGDDRAYRGVTIRLITIGDNCPVCGGPRGKPWLYRFCEDGEWYDVHRWDNPCGHGDPYFGAILEARDLKTATLVSGYDASDWLAADHAGQLRTGDVPRGERADSPARRPATDLECPTCGAAFGDDCDCPPYHALQPGFWEAAALGLRGYREADGYTLHERLASGE